MQKKSTTKTKESETSSQAKHPIQPKVVEHTDKADIEDAIRTLAKAEEIKHDPDMMKKIKPHLDKKVASIDGLKKLYEDKYNQPSHKAKDADDEP